MEVERRMWGIMELGDLCGAPVGCRTVWMEFRRKAGTEGK